METVVLVTRAPSEELLAERRRLGLDTFHEVWSGEHHMMMTGPSEAHAYVDNQLQALLRSLALPLGLIPLGMTNIGVLDDHRVPDSIVVRELVGGTYRDTAALVVEIVSPGDDSWRKFDFYAAHGVDELLLADPGTSTLHWFRLVGEVYESTERSTLLGVDVGDVHAAIDWPTP